MQLDLFPNPSPNRDYLIEHINEEFTSVCPVTGHPDFGTVHLSYIADQTCVELKSLKIYYQSFRNQGIYYEAVTNRILEELVEATQPRWMKVVTEWKGRGGIRSTISAEFKK
ncbi:MAG: preQ(1) synthase [Puniceicoccaceae bacterium]